MSDNGTYIVDTIQITNEMFGKYYMITNKYYGEHEEYLPVIFDFNGISDPTTIKVGQILFLPDQTYIENQLKIILIDENIVPGVNKVSDILSKDGIKTIQNKSKITAVPKLQIQLEQVKYDKSTGKILF